MMSLERDVHSAEALLHALATELRNVPVDERTQALHVRALQLKREVTQWGEAIAAEVRDQVLEELHALRAETAHWQDAPSGRQMADALQGTGTT